MSDIASYSGEIGGPRSEWKEKKKRRRRKKKKKKKKKKKILYGEAAHE
jgi:hypothetical protein